jgi:D-alanyl-D-alanine carboxypeptidase
MTTLRRDLSSTAAAILTEVDAERKRLDVPGVVLAIRTPDGERWSAALGTRDVATGERLAVDAVLRIGSVTKTIVATVILRLTETGDLGLDDEAQTHLPHLNLPSGVTVRRLLGMTAGLPEYTTEEFLTALLAAPERVWRPRELVEFAQRGPQHFAPGDSWEYSNTGYILLGLLAEHATGVLVEDLAARFVFEPLGLQDTSLPPRSPAGTALPDPRVRGYLRDDTALVDATDINPSWAWTAGNALSTADDLVILVEALVRGDLLAEQTQRVRMTGVPIAGTDWAYGLGIADFGGIWGHNGQLPGFQTFTGHDPSTGATIVVLATANESIEHTNPADALALRVRELLASSTA